MTLALVIAALLPAWEMAQVRAVVAEYRLDEERTALLVAIRRAENGKPHLAFGVADPRCRTYARQLRWAANTIRLRYDGDLAAFARRWCPTDTANWLRNVRFFVRKQQIQKKGTGQK